VYPKLIEFPSLHLALRSHTVLLILAILVCVWVGPRWAQALEGLDRHKTRRAILLLGVAALLAGRLHFLLNYWTIFSDRPLATLEFWRGLHAPGAIIGVVVATPWILIRQGLPLGRFADGVTPTIGLGIAVARVGCFLEGCCYGTPCVWPWCVRFPNNYAVSELAARANMALAGVRPPVHPLQLYFAACGFLIAAVALWLLPRKRYDGEISLVALVFFSASSALLEFLRGDHPMRRYWGPLPQLEWTAIAMTAAAIVGLVTAELLHRQRARIPVAVAA
jgi:phosphatidylglycerol:prolipoprotein diacylglycerol transferase